MPDENNVTYLGGGGGGGIKLAAIAVTTQPAKTTYRAGEPFDPAGMVVEATYSNGAKAVATGYSYTLHPSDGRHPGGDHPVHGGRRHQDHPGGGDGAPPAGEHQRHQAAHQDGL